MASVCGPSAGLNTGTNNNSLNISGTPTSTGTYPFTVQVTDNIGEMTTQGYTIVINTQPVGYTVSGTVSYGGSQTGWTYLVLNSSNCTGCNNSQGTSISENILKAGGAFTIHGVQPGTYTLLAFMDNLGYGAENASNPTGATGSITVTNANVTGVSLAMADPGAVTLGAGPTWNGSNGNGPFNGGAFVSFKTVQNNVGIEAPASYTVQWSTSSSFGSVLGSKSFPAVGNNNPYIISGLTNGQNLYFRARGVAGSSTSNWSNVSNAMTIGAPTGANTVSGTVTFSQTATGPLYVGFYDQNTGNIYVDVVGSKSSPPKSPAAYTVEVPTGSNYYFFGFLDQNNSGMFAGAGQVSNTNSGGSQTVVINGNLTNENLTLPSGSSVTSVETQSLEQINQNGTNFYYSIGFNVSGLVKIPVGVELTTGPTPGVTIPVDFSSGAFYGNPDQFSYWAGLNGAVPHVGDTYSMNVTYSDGTAGNPSVAVGAVLNAFATNLSPSPQETGVSTTPTFSWTDPANASSYVYQFQLWDQYGNQIWQIPGNNSNSHGFSSSITSITWGIDPTGSGSLPNVSSLNGSSTYYWQITASDVNGNSAQVQVNFTTAATPLTLPAAGSLGTAIIGQNFNSAINASGGVGPNYYFTVNSNPVPTDGTNISIGDGLYVANTGGNTLQIFGTPASAQTVSFNVSVTDSASDTAGPNTYTITVNPPSPLVIQTTSLPSGNNGWLYNSSVQASGGVQPFTWSVISGSLPSGLSIASDGGSNGVISGTPNSTGTVSFTVQVIDNLGGIASQALTLSIKNCTYTALSGNYAFFVNGWKGQSEIQTTVGSFIANGTGTITSGEIDINDQYKGVQNVAITGTYCVNSNNLAQISFTASGQSGGATFAAALDSSDGNGHIIRYDGTSSEISSGLLRKQTTSAFSTSKINGNYAFGLVGADSGDNRFAVAGVLNMDGSGNVCKAGTIACEYDYNDGGSGQGSGPGNGTISPSTYSVAANGRGTATINSSNGTTSMVFYVVSASELLMMESDTGSNIEAGQVLLQSGTFGLGSLSGVSVIESQGFDTKKSAADAQAGLLTADGNSNITSATIDENDGGSANSESTSGTYTMASNGRGTFSLAAENNPRVMYMVTKNQAFVVSTGGKTGFGTLTPQSGSNFTNSSLSGNYYGGSQEPVDYNVSSEIDSVNANSGTFSVVSDNSSGGCGGNACVDSSTMSVGYTVSGNGRVIICPAGSGTCTQSNQEGIMYIISAAQVVLLPTSDNNPKLDDFHQ